jgi:hypothetical protein
VQRHGQTDALPNGGQRLNSSGGVQHVDPSNVKIRLGGDDLLFGNFHRILTIQQFEPVGNSGLIGVFNGI